MAQRKAYQGYGTAEIPKAKPAGMLPPPPDGTVPARLPVGAPPSSPPPAPQDVGDPLVRLLQQLGRL